MQGCLNDAHHIGGRRAQQDIFISGLGKGGFPLSCIDISEVEPGGPGGPVINDSAQYLLALRLAENGSCVATQRLRCQASARA